MWSATRSSAAASSYPESWYRTARLVWFSVMLLALALYLGGLPGRYYELQNSTDPRILSQLGISGDFYASYMTILGLVLVVTHYIIAGLLFLRLRRDWMALWLSFALITNGVIFPLSLMYPPAETPQPAKGLVEIIIFIGLLTSITLLYIFPNGKFVPRWGLALAVAWAVLNLPGIFWPEAGINFKNWPALIQLLVLVFFAVTGVGAQLYRYYRVSNPLQRQQAKWALFGMTAAVLAPLAYFLPFVIIPNLANSDVPNLLFNRMGSSFYVASFVLRMVGITLFTLGSLAFPFSFTIAIMRYRLWEIDIFINRALVYGALSGLLAAIYLGSVVLLQRLIQLLTGFSQSEVATAASTLLIAAVFVPLQKRVQALIDRRFYRRRYNTAQTLAEFSATLRDEVELEPLVRRMLAVVEDTMQPATMTLWLREPEDIPLEMEELDDEVASYDGG